jgi:hypothetical protein
MTRDIMEKALFTHIKLAIRIHRMIRNYRIIRMHRTSGVFIRR